MIIRFTECAARALQEAKNAAIDLQQKDIGSEHLLIGLLRVKDAVAGSVLEENGVEEEKIIELIEQLIAPGTVAVMDNENTYTPKAERILENSVAEARRFHSELVGTEHVLLTMLREGDCIAVRILNTLGVNIQKLYIDIMVTVGVDPNTAKNDYMNMRGGKKQAKGPQTVEHYCTDLTKKAKENKLDPVIGREDEIKRVIQILSRRNKNNPCLVGEPGVGKTAIVEGIAQMILRGEAPESIANKRVMTLDLSGMVAGSKYRGEFEERIKNLLKEVKREGNILLFIDEIHTIIGAGGAEGAIDASNILKPSLARGEIQIIGATTREEYRKYIEKDAALERRFQPVVVEEPTKEEAIEILKGVAHKYEEHHKVTIEEEALVAAVKLSSRYINDRFLPDKAIDLIDEASSRKRLEFQESTPEIKKMEEKIKELEQQKEVYIIAGKLKEANEVKHEQGKLREKIARLEAKKITKKKEPKISINENDIAEVVAMWTKIPVKRLEEEESMKLRKLQDTLHKRVIGQDEAVKAVANSVKRGRVGLKDPNRPIGSFLFLGPTGVGKTELSKALAESVFGNENDMIRVDMSEYMEQHSVSKMIGSPPGYVGYEEGGQLSEKVRRNPYSVILFDEIEKAHIDVFNVLLQILDDGHVTDSQGRKVDFKNTIIIMTSNAGAQNIVSPKKLGFASKEDSEKNYQDMKNQVMEEVKHIFKPEFLNRIDDIIVFHALEKEDMKQIAQIMLGKIIDRAEKQFEMKLKFTPAAKDFLIEAGSDKVYGARPLRRAIQTHIEDSLADEILFGRVKKGDTVTVGVKDKKIYFSVK